ATDLQTYTVHFRSTGFPDTPPVGTLVDLGDDNYRIVNIPAGSAFTFVVSNEYCNLPYAVTAPDCLCGPISPPVSAGDVDICADEQFPLLSVFVNEELYSVNWYDDAGGIVEMETLSILPQNPGTYYAQTVELASGCLSGESTDVTLTVYPAISVTVSPDVTDCVGKTVSLLALATGGAGGLHYQWDHGLPASASVLYTIADAGPTIVGLTVNDEEGICSTNSGVTVTGIPNPEIIQLEEAVCAEDLQSWSVRVSSSGEDLINSVGTIVPDGDDFLITGIPSGMNLNLSDVLMDGGVSCPASLVIFDPGCACEAIEAPMPIVDYVGACVGEQPPPFMVEDPGAGYTIVWYSEDGSVEESGTPSFVPPSAGTYYARTRKDADNCESDEATTLVFVTAAPPEVSLQAEPAAVCQGNSVQLNVIVTNDPGDLTYTWCDDLGEGPSAQYEADTPGTYTACVTVANDYCETVEEFEITTIETPALNVTTPTGDNCTNNLQTYFIEFSATYPPELPAVGDLIDLGNGDYRLENIPIAEIVQLEVNHLGCQASSTIPPPNCECTAELDPPDAPELVRYCSDEDPPLLMASVNEDLYTVNWYDATGSLLAPATTTYQTMGPGLYLAETLELANGICTSSTLAEIMVERVVDIQINASMDMSDCTGASFLLGAIAINGSGALSYSWSHDLPPTSTVTFTPTEPGTYPLTVTVTDANNVCTSTEEVIVEALPNPTANITESSTILCAGGATGGLLGSGEGGSGNFSAVWSTGNMGFTLNGLVAGLYSLTVTDGEGCSGSADYNLQEPAPLTVDLTVVDIHVDAENNVAMDGSITAAISGGTPPYEVKWVLDNIVVGSGTSTYETGTPGTYTLVVEDDNNCLYSTAIMLMPVDVDEPDYRQSIGLFPNPTTGQLHLEFALPRQVEVQVRLLDALGRQLLLQPLQAIQNGRLSLDLSSYPPAVYWLQLKVEDQLLHYKVIRL
ncbi:MAG: T9SS type A sorting domain-containing protein, partial [Lewinella sp.]|nr:T9SS type A sorting domain-containing protein [Lewinella sp.]